MASLVNTMIESWDDLMINKSDPRVKDWFMMSSPFPTLFICLFYVYFVKVLGPKFMEHRKAFDLKGIMLVYNFLLVIFSAWLFKEAMVTGWGGKYSFVCQPVDYSNSPDAVRMARGCWWYYITKFIELTDTIVFVLRKKNNQVTTLHVIHHGIMPLSVWFGIKFTPGGHASFFGTLNTFVHIWMYLYYFLAAFGPSIQPYLWWKKYLTTLQIVQFVIIIIHELQLVFVDCNYPKAFSYWIAFHAGLFFFMFRDFYNKAYKKNLKKSEKYDLMASVEPDREGIKQSDLWAGNYEHTARKRRENEAKKQQTSVYANDYKMATGYISDEGLRNRAFIDDNRNVDQ